MNRSWIPSVGYYIVCPSMNRSWIPSFGYYIVCTSMNRSWIPSVGYYIVCASTDNIIAKRGYSRAVHRSTDNIIANRGYSRTVHRSTDNIIANRELLSFPRYEEKLPVVNFLHPLISYIYNVLLPWKLCFRVKYRNLMANDKTNFLNLCAFMSFKQQ
jgi:hypothetical protein